MTSLHPCRVIFFLCLLFTNIGSALDAELRGVMQSYQRQVRDLQVRELANYADQLDQLRKTCAAKGDTKSEQQVAAEHLRILAQIKASLGTPASAARSEDTSQDTTSGQTNVEALFQLSTDESPKAPEIEKVSEATVLEFHQGKLTPDAVGRKFWTKADDTIHWTIPSLPAGKYRIKLYYRTPKEDGGGKLKLSASGAKFSLTHQVSSSEKSGGAVHTKEIGRLELSSFPAELSLKLLDTPRMAQPLFELFAVKLIFEPAKDAAQMRRLKEESEKRKQPPTQ